MGAVGCTDKALPYPRNVSRRHRAVFACPVYRHRSGSRRRLETTQTDDDAGETVVAKGKRTFQPNNRRRARKHGFRLRMRTRAGRAIISARRRKGRERLTA